MGGSRGAPIITFEFHVISHVLTGLFIDYKNDATVPRWEHVEYKHKGAGMAVAIIPPLTFKRRGPRDEPTAIKATITAGVGVLAARNRAAPDWRFASDVPDDSIHKPPIAGRVIDIHRSHPGVV